jgi:hypothetical protein
MKLWTRKDIKTLLDGRPERYGIVYLWFGVSLVYKSSAPLDEQGTHLFEEQIISFKCCGRTGGWDIAVGIHRKLNS